MVKKKKNRQKKEISEVSDNTPSSKNRFSKILVTGHPLCGYEKVTELLHANGMARAKSSTDGKTVTEVTEILLKSNSRDFNDTVVQREINPIWNQLTLDILLENIDQELWGWGDSQAIELLEYWYSVDPSMAFVLVYATPEAYLQRLMEENSQISEKKIKQYFKEWEAYNEMMLAFYYKHPENTLLINSTQFHPDNFKQIQPLIAHIGIENVSILERGSLIDDNLEMQRLFEYLSHKAIKKLSYHFDTYYELEAISHLPFRKLAKKYSPIKALHALIAEKKNQQQQGLSSKTRIMALEKENEEKGLRLVNLQKELQKQENHMSNLVSLNKKEMLEKKKSTTDTSGAEKLEKQNQELKEELQEIQENLFTTQEMLEEYYLSNERLRRELENTERKLRVAEQKKNNCKKHLRYKVGSLIADNAKNPIGWITLPIKILSEVKKHRAQKRG